MSTTTREPAIHADSLTKTYGAKTGAVHALRGVSFDVAPGSVFALLGPNGAGKSTTVKILTTLSAADSGSATVAGHSVQTEPAQVRRSIGYVSQKPSFDPIGTGWENLIFQARVFGISPATAKARAAELLDRFGLRDAASRLTQKWSGGMQRKLDVAMGLIHRPAVLFLDEPTTGLDPQARTEMWAEIARLTRDDGLTVLLTTHYLEEADQLADQLVIIDQGRVVAAGSPDRLKAELAGDAIAVDLGQPDQVARATQLLAALPEVGEITTEGSSVRARVANGAVALPRVMGVLDGAGIGLAAITVARPSLDDVYLRHAGRSFRADAVPATDELVGVA